MTKLPVAFISDVHGNLPALKICLQHMGDSIECICAGDTVDDGPHPRECLDLVRQRCSVILAGNHDLAAAGVRDYYMDVIPSLRPFSDWTAHKLHRAERRFLRSLPCQHENDRFVVSHAMSRRGPSRHDGIAGVGIDYVRATTYVGLFRDFEDKADEEIFHYLHECRHLGNKNLIELHGHTHTPYIKEENGRILFNGPRQDRMVYDISDTKVAVNIPSVGLPRDHDKTTNRFDTRTGYVLVDDRNGKLTVTVVRLEQDFEAYMDQRRALDLKVPFSGRVCRKVSLWKHS
jgi:predicted phosphodiesterase